VTSTTREVAIDAEGATLLGLLTVPPGARGVVVFAHGSGSGRLSRRNAQVARTLEEAGFATLLMDLLTEAEERSDARTGHLRFDIPLLAGRLRSATRWLAARAETRELPVAYFGASTGAAAALVAAAAEPGIFAIVSRGGRPDLAGGSLGDVLAPTLFIVGGADVPIIPLNQQAFQQLTCVKEQITIPRATHLFEEPGALEQVARHAVAWFDRHGPRPR